MYQDNQFVMKICLATGLRVTDVLNLRLGDLRRNQKLRIVEHKTGKLKTVYIPAKLREEILETRDVSQHDGYYVFPARTHWRTHHRSRQAVWKDIKRVIARECTEIDCSPHTARKVFAVTKYHEGKNDLEKVRKLLNHANPATTKIYALSDIL